MDLKGQCDEIKQYQRSLHARIWSTVSMTQPTFFTIGLSFNLYQRCPCEDQLAATVGCAASSLILVKFIFVRSSKNG